MSRPNRGEDGGVSIEHLGTVSLLLIGAVLSVIVFDVAGNMGASGWLTAALVVSVFVVLAAFGAVTYGRDTVVAMVVVAPVALVRGFTAQLFL